MGRGGRRGIYPMHGKQEDERVDKDKKDAAQQGDKLAAHKNTADLICLACPQRARGQPRCPHPQKAERQNNCPEYQTAQRHPANIGRIR